VSDIKPGDVVYYWHKKFIVLDVSKKYDYYSNDDLKTITVLNSYRYTAVPGVGKLSKDQRLMFIRYDFVTKCNIKDLKKHILNETVNPGQGIGYEK
jgi:hypothetical protein